MTLPGKTEAGSAGMQPCRGIAWWSHRNDVAGRGSSPFALFPKTHRIGRPLCLENPRPEGAEYSLTESATSPFHAHRFCYTAKSSTRRINTYLNYHRPCGFAEIQTRARGKKRRVYRSDDYQTPFEKLTSLADWQQYLK